ncbi:MAG: DUF3185 family protein [Pseudomonadales bacterium]
MSSNKLVGVVLVVLGIVLLYFGWQASQSMTEQVTESFTGTFTDSTMWYIIGGAVALAAGAFMAFRR